jgi:HPt (histidine-containing phosphotransfer) domain-containing protein
MAVDDALLNREILDETAELGVESLQELLDMYFEQAELVIGQIQDAIKSDAPITVEELAHKLVGSSVVCGVTGMVTPLRALEQLGRENLLTNADQFVAEATKRLKVSRQLLAEYIAQKSRT